MILRVKKIQNIELEDVVTVFLDGLTEGTIDIYGDEFYEDLPRDAKILYLEWLKKDFNRKIEEKLNEL